MMRFELAARIGRVADPPGDSGPAAKFTHRIGHPADAAIEAAPHHRAGQNELPKTPKEATMNGRTRFPHTTLLLALAAIACTLVPVAGGAGLTNGTPPAFKSAPGATFVVGTAGSFTIDANSGSPAPSPTPAISIASGSLPFGLSFQDNGNGTATISGTPWDFEGGVVPLTLQASNTAGTVTQSFQLTIDEAPTFANTADATFQVGVAGGFAFWTGSGYPAATVSLSSGSLPSWLSWKTDPNGNQDLDGTPPVGSGGVYTFTVKASNGISPDDLLPFTLTVEEGLAFTSAASASFTTGTPGSFAISTSHHYPTAATISVVGGSLPAGLTLTDNGDGTASISGTAATGSAGTYNFSLLGSNGVIGGDTVQAFGLTVVAGPSTPAQTTPPATQPDPTPPATAPTDIASSPSPSTSTSTSSGALSAPQVPAALAFPTAATTTGAPATAVLARFTFTHRLTGHTRTVAAFTVAARTGRNQVTFDALAGQNARLARGRYTLSAFVAGRSVHGTCVAKTSGNRGAHSCRRLVTMATFTVKGLAAKNRVTVRTLVIEGRKLPAGLYVLSISAINRGAALTLGRRQLTLAVGA